MGIGDHKIGTSRSKMSERRKSSKPIMEKKRRERINNSLNELKNLLLESRKKDTTCCSKLEKADILEMTVQYLKSIRSQQEKASTTADPVALAHYRAGFNHSAMEISRYLIDSQDIEVKVRTRLLAYLSNSCHAVLSDQSPMKQYHPFATTSLYPTSIPQTPELSTRIQNDTLISTFTPQDPLPYYIKPTQLQLMPALTNGKLAAVFVPSHNLFSTPYQPQLKLEPGSSTSTITHAKELLARTTDTSNNDSNLSDNTHTSSQASTPGDGSVWRPWS